MKNTTILFLVTIILGCPTLSNAQTAITDSTALEYFYNGFNNMRQQPDSAIYWFKQARELFQQQQDWDDYVDCLNGLANCHYIKGEYELMEEQILLAINTAEQHLGKQDKVYTAALNNMGLQLRRKGNYPAALKYMQQALETDLGHNPNPLSIAISHHNVGNIHRLMGDYDEAINQLNRALVLRKDSLGDNNYLVADTYLAIGHNYRSKAVYAEAQNYYQRYLDLITSGQIAEEEIIVDNTLFCYQSLVEIAIETGQSNQAQRYIDKALKIQQLAKTKRQIQSFEMLGKWHLQNQKPAEALNTAQQAVKLANQKYKKYQKHTLKSRTSRLLGKAWAELGQLDSALHYLHQSLVLLAFDFENPSIDSMPKTDRLISKVYALESVVGKAEILYKRFQLNSNPADLKLALAHYLYAAQLIEAMRQSFILEESKHTLSAAALTVYEGGIQAAMHLHASTQAAHYLETAFTLAERNKSMQLLESMQDSEAKLSGQLTPEDLSREQQLSANINFYGGRIIREKQKAKKANEEKIKAWTSQLFRLKEEHKQLIRHFELQYPQYYHLKYNTQIASPEALRKQIINNQNALIEYFIGEEQSYIFCLTANDLTVHTLSNTQTLFEQQAQLLDLLQKPPFDGDFAKDHARYGQLLSQLSQQLIQPLLPQLHSTIRQLIIIPEDQLSYLPFEVLLYAPMNPEAQAYSIDNFPYLLSRYAISSNYSATLLLNQAQPSASKDLTPFVGFAPSFGSDLIASNRNCSASELYSLQCNQQEVNAINKLFEGAVQLGALASTAAFREQAAQARILHLATHACAGQENPALNKVFFADGYLATPELQSMQLKAELAVLSACNTGAGKLVKGEGVMSLSRSFILAGCPSTLMSLWTVDDCFTSELMFRFYAKLKEGLAKDEALRQTKLEHLAQADQAGRHPYYWAPFIQSGNPEAMQFGSASFGWARLALLLGVIIFGYIKFRK